MMLLHKYTINGYEEKSIIEINHFIIQQVRIPLKEAPSIRKIIQIALNIGQYKGSGGKMIFDNIGQFIYQKDIVELSKHIPGEVVGKIRAYLIVL
jgi:hypothetical protein